jgi:hypothetical protein
MGKKTPAAPPPPPDPYAVAAAQGKAANQTAISQAIIGNANEISPYGNITYNQIGRQNVGGVDVPQFSRTTTLSPEQQALYNQQNQLSQGVNNLALGQVNRLTGHLDQPVNAGSLPQWAGNVVPENFSADRQRVEQAMFDRLNPQMQRAREAEENRLVNQGFQRGTEAYTGAMGDIGRAENDARLAITERGLGEQQGLFNMALSGGQFSNAQRQQALQEMLALRNQPINEITALMSGGQVSLPQAQQYQAPQVAPTNIADYMYNTAALQQQNYKTQEDYRKANLQGMYGLGSAALGGGGYFAGKKWGG